MTFLSGRIVLAILFTFHNSNGINGHPFHSDDGQLVGMEGSNIMEGGLTRYNLIREDCYIPLMEAFSSPDLTNYQLKKYIIGEFTLGGCIENVSPLLKENIEYEKKILDAAKNESNAVAKMQYPSNHNAIIKRSYIIHTKNVKRSLFTTDKFKEMCMNGTILTGTLQVIDTLLTLDPTMVRGIFFDELDTLSSLITSCKSESEEYKKKMRTKMESFNRDLSQGRIEDENSNFVRTFFLQMTHAMLKLASIYTQRFKTLENELNMIRETSKSYSYDNFKFMFIIRDYLIEMKKNLQKSAKTSFIIEDVLESKGISKYVHKIINMFGLKEYQKINPSLLNAKDHALTWTTQTQPKVILTYENLQSYFLHIDRIETETSQLCNSISFLYSLKNINNIHSNINSIERKVSETKAILNVMLLFNQRLSKLRMTQSSILEKSLSELKSTFYGDWEQFQRKLKGLLNHKNDLSNKIDNLDKMRKDLEQKKNEVQRKLEEAIQSRDKQKRDKQISTGVLNFLSFLTVFIPVVGPYLSTALFAGSLGTEVGMTVSIAQVTKVVHKLEADMNSINSKAVSILSLHSSNMVDMRSINEFLGQLDGLTEIVDPVNVKFKIIRSFYSFNSGKLFSIIKQLQNIKVHSDDDNFCFLKPDIQEMSKDFNILMDNINNPAKNRQRRDNSRPYIVDVKGAHNHVTLTPFVEEINLKSDENELNDEQTDLNEREVLNSFIIQSIRSTDERKVFIKLLEEQFEALDHDEAVLLKKDFDNILILSK